VLVEQHVGFALTAASTYHVMESGRVSVSGDGGSASGESVRAAMTI
jgi:urea transport system ATP-binding protein